MTDGFDVLPGAQQLDEAVVLTGRAQGEKTALAGAAAEGFGKRFQQARLGKRWSAHRTIMEN